MVAASIIELIYYIYPVFYLSRSFPVLLGISTSISILLRHKKGEQSRNNPCCK